MLRLLLSTRRGTDMSLTGNSNWYPRQFARPLWDPCFQIGGRVNMLYIQRVESHPLWLLVLLAIFAPLAPRHLFSTGLMVGDSAPLEAAKDPHPRAKLRVLIAAASPVVCKKVFGGVPR